MNALDHRLEKVRRAFPFEVAKLPLYGPDREPTGYYGLFADDTGTPVRKSSVSKVYEPHTTEDVLALAEAAISTFPDIGDQGDFTAFFSGGHCLSFAPRQEHRQAIFGTKDNIWPRINIRAMYDGKAFRASCGYFRDACRNMAEIKSVRSTNVTIRHDGGLRDKMDDLVKQFRSLSTGWSNLKDWALTQEDNRVNLRDFIHDLYGEPDADASERTRSGYRNRATDILERIQRERVATDRPNPSLSGPDWACTGWEVWNGIQGWNQWSRSRRGNVSDVQRAFLANQEPSVQRAAEMLTEMAV